MNGRKVRLGMGKTSQTGERRKLRLGEEVRKVRLVWEERQTVVEERQAGEQTM